MIECQCEKRGECEVFQRFATGRDVEICRGIGANSSVERTEETQADWAATAGVAVDELSKKYPKAVAAAVFPPPCCNQPKPKTPSRFAKGVGLIKAVVGLDKSPDEIIAKRLALCQNCEYQALGVCTACSCYVSAKAAVRSQECPLGYWDNQTTLAENLNLPQSMRSLDWRKPNDNRDDFKHGSTMLVVVVSQRIAAGDWHVLSVRMLADEMILLGDDGEPWDGFASDILAYAMID